MLKLVFFSVLFLLSYTSLMVSAAKGGAKAKGGTKAPKKEKDEKDPNAVLRQACYDNCESIPAKTNHKMAVFVCQGICDKNHPKGPTFGCHKNYCWSACSGAGIGEEWCYTSKESYTQSFKYVSCKSDSECQKDWKCAGSCTI